MSGKPRHVFSVEGSTATPAVPIALAEAGLKERSDLQEWVIAHPEVLGGGVLIITSEFDQWASLEGGTAKERLDVLGLDESGRLVVVELKRDGDSRIHLQAITYAALVSNFDEEALSEAYSAFLTKRGKPTNKEAALALIRDHAGGELDLETLSVPRILLLAGHHPAQVVTSVVWLSKLGLDIELHQVVAYQAGSQINVTFDQIYPVPGVDSQLLAPARKQAAFAVEKAQERERAASAVRTIVEEALLQEGSQLVLMPTTEVVADVRASVSNWIQDDSSRGRASWTNDPKRPLVWEADGQAWQPTTLVRHILSEAAGIERTVRGTAWWVSDDGMNLAEIAGIASSTQGRDWSDLHELISLIGPGEWTSYGDLGEVLGLHGRPIGSHIGRCGTCPEGAWRVLTFDGQPSPSFHWQDPGDTREVAAVLKDEGIKLSDAGRADPDQRVRAETLASRWAATKS